MPGNLKPFRVAAVIDSQPERAEVADDLVHVRDVIPFVDVGGDESAVTQEGIIRISDGRRKARAKVVRRGRRAIDAGSQSPVCPRREPGGEREDKKK